MTQRTTSSTQSAQNPPGVDVTALNTWLDTTELPGDSIDNVKLLAGGTQNILLAFTRGGTRYVLRRPPLHKRANSDATMLREARVLRALADTDVPHPRLVACCEDVDVIGGAFYVMDEIEGVNPAAGLDGEYARSGSWRQSLGLEMAAGAASIAKVDHRAVGLADFGRPDGYLERQVSRWRSQLESYGQFAAYTGPGDVGLDRIGEWLEQNLPSDFKPGLVHGDFHFANVLARTDEPQLAAIIDWELSTIGDPLLDLGNLLSTWPRAGMPELPERPGWTWDGFPTAEKLIEHYAELTGRDLRSLRWFEVLACYKIGIILEGTFARSVAGEADPRIGEQLRENARHLFARARAHIDSQ